MVPSTVEVSANLSSYINVGALSMVPSFKSSAICMFLYVGTCSLPFLELFWPGGHWNTTKMAVKAWKLHTPSYLIPYVHWKVSSTQLVLGQPVSLPLPSNQFNTDIDISKGTFKANSIFPSNLALDHYSVEARWLTSMANHSAEVGGCNLYTPWLTFPTHPPPPQTSICKTLTAAKKKKKTVHQQHLTQQNPVLIKIYPKNGSPFQKKSSKSRFSSSKSSKSRFSSSKSSKSSTIFNWDFSLQRS